MKKIVVVCLVLFSAPLSGKDGGELPRRAAIGAMLAPVSEEIRTELHLPAEGGVLVQQIVAGSSASAAGLQPGEVILSAEGETISSTQALVQLVQQRKAGDSIRLVTVSRSGERSDRLLTLKEFARETSDSFTISYESASADGNRYRTIMTRPSGEGPFPAISLVQGIGCFSLDAPGSGFPYERIAHELTRRGYVTLRTDKPGTGDSEGGPCSAVDFQTEVRAYQAALVELAKKPYVDREQIFVFGHSMGGVMAPLLDEATPLRGAVVYGTAFHSWLYYSLETSLRQMRLAGRPFDEIEAELEADQRFLSRLLIEKEPLEKLVENDPALKEAFPDGTTFVAGKHYRYVQQIQDLNLAREWKEAQVPVLAVWGSADFVASEGDHQWLADAVESWIPGGGKYLKLENVDHFLNRAETFEQSMEQGPFGGEFDPQIIEILDRFMTSPPSITPAAPDRDEVRSGCGFGPL